MSSVSLTLDPLLEKLEIKLACVIALTYQKKIEEAQQAVSEVVELTQALKSLLPEIIDVDWFKAILGGSQSFLSSMISLPQLEKLHDVYFYNVKHIVRFRRDEKSLNQNNRIAIEDLFSTAVKVSQIEKQFISLIEILTQLDNKFEIENSRLAKHFYKIKKFASDCECYSLLSIEVSWEIICCLVSEIETLTELPKDSLREMFGELEKSILNIESSICGILEMVNLELQVNFSITKADLNYRRHFNNNSIFA